MALQRIIHLSLLLLLLALIATNSGLGLVLDATAAEGVEFSAPTWANSQKSFCR